MTNPAKAGMSNFVLSLALLIWAILVQLPTIASFTVHHDRFQQTRPCNDGVQRIIPVKIKGKSHNRIMNILSSTPTDDDALPDPSSMRIREIKDELNAMGVSFTDCFDKDSLSERLVDARSGKIVGDKSQEERKEEGNKTADEKEKPSEEPKSSASKPASTFDKEAVGAELRSKKVKELRTMCAKYNIRWAQMIEKEELVQALLKHQEKAAGFSVSGKIMPGEVAKIDEDILAKEVAPGAASTPLLLGECVYLFICIICKFIIFYQ